MPGASSKGRTYLPMLWGGCTMPQTALQSTTIWQSPPLHLTVQFQKLQWDELLSTRRPAKRSQYSKKIDTQLLEICAMFSNLTCKIHCTQGSTKNCRTFADFAVRKCSSCYGCGPVDPTSLPILQIWLNRRRLEKLCPEILLQELNTLLQSLEFLVIIYRCIRATPSFASKE